jgi:hypothetical protein
MEIVERLRTALEIEEHMYDPVKKETLDRECKEFQHFARQIVPLLKDMQKKLQYTCKIKVRIIQTTITSLVFSINTRSLIWLIM